MTLGTGVCELHLQTHTLNNQNRCVTVSSWELETKMVFS